MRAFLFTFDVMGLIQLQAAFARIDLVTLTGEAMLSKAQAVLDKNREQMIKGQNIDDQPFKPYTSDPYFQGNTAKAEAYGRFKQRVTPQSPPERPNFFINGYTHGQMTLTVQGTQYTITSGVQWAGRIQSWQDNKVFGLTPDSREELWNNDLRPYVSNRIKQITGL